MKLRKDQTVEGEITRVVEEAVFVDVGAAHDVVIPKVDIDQVKGNPAVTLEVGEIVPVYIYYAPENGGNPLGSVAHALGIPYLPSHPQSRLSNPWACVGYFAYPEQEWGLK